MTIGQRIRIRRESLHLSQDELAKKLGYKSRSSINKIENECQNLTQSKIKAIADALETTPAYIMGWLEEEGIPAGFEPLPEMKKAPLVGRIACGTPILAEQNIDEYIDVPIDKHIDFCLRCVGDSMRDAGIQDGDTVFIRKQPDVENGQIAAVRIDCEATLKRVYKEKGRITLYPANPNYMPKIYVGAECEQVCIEGLAVGFQHWL